MRAFSELNIASTVLLRLREHIIVDVTAVKADKDNVVIAIIATPNDLKSLFKRTALKFNEDCGTTFRERRLALKNIDFY